MFYYVCLVLVLLIAAVDARATRELSGWKDKLSKHTVNGGKTKNGNGDKWGKLSKHTVNGGNGKNGYGYDWPKHTVNGGKSKSGYGHDWGKYTKKGTNGKNGYGYKLSKHTVNGGKKGYKSYKTSWKGATHA